LLAAGVAAATGGVWAEARSADVMAGTVLSGARYRSIYTYIKP
jgi:hypothetical protein